MTAKIPDITITYCTCDKPENECRKIHEGDFEDDAFEIWEPSDKRGTLYGVSTTEGLIIELLGIGVKGFEMWQAGECMVKVLSTRKTYDAVDILNDNKRLVRKYAK